MRSLTVEEFREQYGERTERRQELCRRFVEWLHVARASGMLLRVWVYGSFPSDKRDPNDVDVIAMVPRKFRRADLAAGAQPYFDNDFCQSVWAIDLHLHEHTVPDLYIEDLLNILRRDRNGQETLTEVVL